MTWTDSKAGLWAETLELLQPWSRLSLDRLTPLTGEDDARRLIDALFSECVGRRLDALVPVNDLSPEYSDLREFFQRFAPQVVLYLPCRDIPATSLQRLHELHRAICIRIASDFPATLGRFGRTLFSREWKTIDAELPSRMEASWKLAHVEGGEALEAECRFELEAILHKELGERRDPKAVLELHQVARKWLCRRALALSEDH